MACKTVSAAAITLALSTTLAPAATFEIFTGASNVIGTFEAPEAGGLVANLLIEQSGVIFDTRVDAGGAFDYDPLANDFRPLTTIEYTNSVNYPGVCGPGACALVLFPLPDDPVTPGDIFAIDAALNNIDEGTRYLIDPIPIMGDPPDLPPIPLPMPAGLLLGGLGSLWVLRGRR